MEIDSILNKYCKHVLRVHVETLRYNRQTKTWYWDLPAAISVAHDYSKKRHKNGYSHRPEGTKWNERIRLQLEKLGDIGTKSTLGKRYIIGNCAEQHAGNNYMNKYRDQKLYDIHFSLTLRPRTMQILAPCDNCKFTFPNLL